MGDHHKPDRQKAQTDTNLLLTQKSRLDNHELRETADRMRHSDTDVRHHDMQRFNRVFSVVTGSIFSTRLQSHKSRELQHPVRSNCLPRLPKRSS